MTTIITNLAATTVEQSSNELYMPQVSREKQSDIWCGLSKRLRKGRVPAKF